jgi:hypothetical protein
MGVRAIALRCCEAQISFAGAKGDRFSSYLSFEGVDFVEDNAIK